jgi:hypothetical protein
LERGVSEERSKQSEKRKDYQTDEVEDVKGDDEPELASADVITLR